MRGPQRAPPLTHSSSASRSGRDISLKEAIGVFRRNRSASTLSIGTSNSTPHCSPATHITVPNARMHSIVSWMYSPSRGTGVPRRRSPVEDASTSSAVRHAPTVVMTAGSGRGSLGAPRRPPPRDLPKVLMIGPHTVAHPVRLVYSATANGTFRFIVNAGFAVHNSQSPEQRT